MDTPGSATVTKKERQVWARQYTVLECREANATDPRVHNDEYLCQWVAPYGFVPEAGCPLHDGEGQAGSDRPQATGL